MKHKPHNGRVPVMDAPMEYRKTSSMGPAQFTGKTSEGPVKTRSWSNGSYSPTDGRAVKVGEKGKSSYAQIPRAGRNTTDDGERR